MTRQTRLALSVALGGLVIVLDTTIAVLAMPVLMRELHSPLSTVQWVTTAYVLALVATMPLAAWLGARVGQRRAYVAALLVFAIGSAWAGLAHGAGDLIAARVVQGLGGGLVNPIGMTLALREVSREHRGRTAALLGLPVLVGPLVGPVLAGWLVDAVSWRAIFLVTIVPAVLAAALVHRYAATDITPGRGRRLDVVGSLLLVVGAVLLVVGVAEAGLPVVLRLAVTGSGIALVLAFGVHAWRGSSPLLQVRLFADPVFAASAVVLALFSAAYFGSMLLSPTYLQVTRGSSALTAGSLAIPGGLVTGLSLQVATRLVDRVAPARVLVSGLTIASAGSLTGIVVLRADTPLWVVAGLACVLGAGSGGVLMPSMAVATRDLVGDALASGSALLSLLSQLANAVGTAGVSALFAGMVAWRAPELPGGLGSAGRLHGSALAAVAPDLVTAQRLTQGGVLTVFLLALAVAARLPWRDRTEAEMRPVPCESGVGR